MTGFGAEAGGVSVEDGYARAVLDRFQLQYVARLALPGERVCHCLRHRIAADASPVLLYSPKRDRGHWGNLQVCGLLWVCAVCAAKITERRRVEVAAGLDRWRLGGGAVLFGTLTHAHEDGTAIAVAVDRFLRVRRWMGQQRTYREFCRRFQVEHSIRALEFTQGENGPHVHGHEGYLLAGGAADVAEFAEGLYGQWSAALAHFGLTCSRENGVRVDLSDGKQALARYLAKVGHEPKGRLWELPDELTKSHIKRGRLGGLTAWDFLRAFGATGELQYRDWFRDFAAAFKGRHQLQWSRGCRAALGLGQELTDQQLAEAPQDRLALLLAALTDRQWRAVRGLNRQGEAVTRCRGGDGAALAVWLAEVEADYERASVSA